MALKEQTLTATKKIKRVTVHDVARVAGVAIGTVSRVVNDAPSVTEEVRSKVLKAISELGWTPNAAAQGMRGVSARMIGFIFSDIRNPLYSSMVKGAEDALSDKGYMLVVASSNSQPEREVALVKLFTRRRADGLLFTVEEESDADMLQTIKAARFPVVLIERELALPIDTVGADHFNGTRQATEYLLSLGHRRIAMISGGKTNRVGRDRLSGFLQAHQHAGVPVDRELLRLDSFATEYGFRETQVLLGMSKRPTAIISSGMHLLSGVLEAVRMKGLDIPGDISLITSNDTELARLATPAISVIRYDPYALGREAALQLLRRIARETPVEPIRIEIPTEFVLRQSCSPPRS
ncbi:LacI family transcriptional regulator [Candidimonas sp. SYP-B2681]|uniref:LacI family DNA-binding transcriptional regulator n=1 Tax=Candidimonas sp. SYP-B2681 TaxID=2497686 RepID=UPI000F892C0F|nr:substrate-binding domain-containing protein [Candidimonas sp. SYP-B2681]RTZ43375.1 LacI family transcriptional regulator [Candidimonas sp. SYP-B2681]